MAKPKNQEPLKLHTFYLPTPKAKLDQTRAFQLSILTNNNRNAILYGDNGLEKRVSLPLTYMRGKETKDLTLHHLFGTNNPTIKPHSVLVQGTAILGIRFESLTCYAFDIELGVLPQEKVAPLLNDLPKEELLLVGQVFTTGYEQKTKRLVPDLSDCKALLEYLNGN